MDSTVTTTTMPTSFLISKNSIILVLVVLLILSFLGINILSIGSNLLSAVSNIVVPFFINILAFLGYTTGTLLSTSSVIVGESAKKAIDVAQDTLHESGNALVNISKTKLLGDSIQTGKHNNVFDPEPVSASNPVITKNNSGWCLVGEYKDQRGCVEVDETDKCMSGQIFPSKQACLTPT